MMSVINKHTLNLKVHKSDSNFPQKIIGEKDVKNLTDSKINLETYFGKPGEAKDATKTMKILDMSFGP